MGRMIGDNLVLSAKESRNLMNSLMYPDIEALQKRNKLLNCLDDLCLKSDNSMPAFEIPDFPVSFVTKIIYSPEKIRQNQYKICTENEFPVNISYSGNMDFMQIELNSNDGYYLQKNEGNQYTNTVLSFRNAA